MNASQIRVTAEFGIVVRRASLQQRGVGYDQLGLVNVDDFFVFSGTFPDWCQFSASLVRE